LLKTLKIYSLLDLQRLTNICQIFVLFVLDENILFLYYNTVFVLRSGFAEHVPWFVFRDLQGDSWEIYKSYWRLHLLFILFLLLRISFLERQEN